VLEEKEIKVSMTDPASGYLQRDGKPEGFFYLDHRTVDAKYNIITDTYITPGNVHDSVPYLDRLQRQSQRFGFSIEAVALDSGYLTAPICRGLQKEKIFAVIGHRRFHSKRGLLPKWKFIFDKQKNIYRCPEGHELTYRTTNREGYREYRSDARQCRNCPRLKECTGSKNCVKQITRHVWEDSREWVRENRLSDIGKLLYKKRQETIERSYADAKQLHGFRYCRFRGQEKAQEQALMTAACQNMKKIATYLAKMA
jgi:hypothetical protein